MIARRCAEILDEVQKIAHTPASGKYQVIKHLASGGMAEVHLARSTGIGGFERYVVLKKILGEHARDPRFVEMFLDEARLAAQLHHQNIAQVYDIGEDDGSYFFAMEYVHGEDVRALLRKVAALRRQVPTELALAIVSGAAAGLHYAHEKRGPDRQPLGLVHRDVSPSNVLVAYDGAVKLVDFGIAKAATRSSETKSGTLKGKVAYMSPEQCLGKPLDRRSDVFSLGVVMYEITTLTRLFRFENDYVTMHQIVTGVVPPPSKRRSDYPPGLEAIVMRCLERDPEARWPSAGALLEAIEAYAAEHRLAMSPQALGRYVRELFGERPEPWLETEKTGPEHVSLMHEDGDDVLLAVTNSQVGPAMTRETVPEVSAPPPVVKKAARKRWLVIGALVVASAVGGGFLATRGKTEPSPSPSTSTSTSTVPAQKSEPVPVPVPVPMPDPVPVPIPVPAEPKVAKTKIARPKKPPTKDSKPVIEVKVPEVSAPERDTSILIRPSQKKEHP